MSPGRSGISDARGRPLGSLRISVTDRCNLRCRYCMPESEYVWLPSAEVLTFDEISRLTDVFTDLGVTKVRLTGGEPLLRPKLARLVESLAAKPDVQDLALTTNGVLLGDALPELRKAGLHRITVSLDTLRPDRFARLSQRSTHGAVLEGIRAVADAGMTGTKIDTVVMRDFNDDELAELIEFGRQVRAEVRFIEYMDVGGATGWSMAKVYGRRDILSTLGDHYGRITELPNADAAPADRFQLPDGTTFGIISTVTHPFCATCDRSRLTADGMWLRCLYASTGTDLRGPLRDGATEAEMRTLVATTWAARDDQGAVARLGNRGRGVLIPVDQLRRDPHLEMHTRGG
jgi:cyclic pyranopterin phosphate synthase